MQTYYATYARLIINKTPSLLCSNEEDIFKTPIGLITADEVQMGGIVYNSPVNTSSYLYTNSSYWTISPYDYGTMIEAGMFYVRSPGYLSWNDIISNNTGVRPVINLKSSSLFEGGGTGLSNNPYVVHGT